jgi:hypothetical protein
MITPPRSAWAGSGFMTLLLLCFVLPVTSGCFALQPVTDGGPVPGDQVRLTLSPESSDRLSERIGRPVRSIQGRVLAVTPESLRLEVTWGAVYAGTPLEGQREVLELGTDEFSELERRELSTLRSALAVAGVVTVLALLARSLSSGGQGTGPGPSDPSPF